MDFAAGYSHDFNWNAIAYYRLQDNIKIMLCGKFSIMREYGIHDT